MQREKKSVKNLTSSAEVHWVADCVVPVDAERHQDVRRRVRDQNLLILIFSAKIRRKQTQDKSEWTLQINVVVLSFRPLFRSDTFLATSTFFSPRYVTSRGRERETTTLYNFCWKFNSQNRWAAKGESSRRDFGATFDAVSLTCEKRMTLQAMLPACQATVIFHTMSVRTLMTPTLKSFETGME